MFYIILASEVCKLVINSTELYLFPGSFKVRVMELHSWIKRTPTRLKISRRGVSRCGTS